MKPLMFMTDDALKKYPVELVVAHYQEDLRWLRRVPESVRITICQKGDAVILPENLFSRLGLRVVPLPNVGRESHSYLTHLVEHHDELAPVTVFAQGHPFDHAPDFHERLRELAEEEERAMPFRWFGFLDETDDPFGRRLFVPWSKNPERKELSTGLLYERLFGEPSPEYFYFRGGAQFAVSREAVLRRPWEFYEKALKLSVEIPDAAHSFERIWDRVFGERMIDPADLGAEGVRYLKKIQRLEKVV